ncbi:hypothetical protein NQZ68_006227 [Dissostichus eleginoides]|nr:hypothetical protein NQZ68_006227 [Dissostichus eleginoides]
MERGGGGCVGLMDTLCRGREGRGGGRWASPRLGETTVAGERERRGREGGRLVKPRIFMKTPKGRQKGKETGEKARRGPAHLAIDLQAIKGNLHPRGHTDTDSRMDPDISNLEF